MTLDFSILTDDQLIELLKAAMSEALQRGEATRMAAQGCVLDAQEKAAIEAKVAAKFRHEQLEAERKQAALDAEAKLKKQQQQTEQEKIKNLWLRKKALVQALKDWGIKESFDFSVWSRGSDRRVYFQQSKKNGWKVSLFLTGNAYHPPLYMETENEDAFPESNPLKKDLNEDWVKLRNLFVLVASHWSGDLKLSSRELQTFTSLDESKYRSYLSELQIEELASV